MLVVGELACLDVLRSFVHNMGTNWLPAARMVSTTVARFVAFVEVPITMVFVPKISSIFLRHQQIYWRLVHIDDPL